MANFINMLLGHTSPKGHMLPKADMLKVVVVEFAEYGNYGFGQKLTKLLQRNPCFNVRYFDEPFDKTFLNLHFKFKYLKEKSILFIS